ncbi:hypothetical protein Q9233_000589 [Columba guinea]|nr:hypothetical protein Q9233_000589 [Columba guinea]
MKREAKGGTADGAESEKQEPQASGTHRARKSENRNSEEIGIWSSATIKKYLSASDDMKSFALTGSTAHEDPLKCAWLSSCLCHDFEAIGLDQALRAWQDFPDTQM